MSAVLNRLDTIIEEHRSVAAVLRAEEVDALAAALVGAKRVFLSGQGRSGNMVRALAIRFTHIGLAVNVAGEPTAGAIGPGDLLIAVSASATTKATLEHMRVAKQKGAAVALVTTVQREVEHADLRLTLPIRSTVPTVQHAGSLFEQAFLLVGDALAWDVQQRLGVTDRTLDERHANLQ